MIYIFWTCKNRQEAKTIIHQLLKQNLIACASILPEVESIYRWQGLIEESLETKVILKTLKPHFPAIQTLIQAHCSYEVPEIVEIEAQRANPAYLKWIEEEASIAEKS